jgi:branched-chain amino acid transport system substrate-binding protein
MRVRIASALGSLFAGTAVVLLGFYSAFAMDTLKVGVIGPMTGPGAQWGLAAAGGVQIAAREVNAKGGLKVGSKTYQVEVIPYDEEYKAAVAISAMRRLVSQDGVKFVFGPVSSAGTLAVMDIVKETKTIGITGAYSSKALNPSNAYMFRVYSVASDFAQPMVKWLKKSLPANVKRVAIINPNDETGWDSDKMLAQLYKQYGYTVAGKELYERSVRDYIPILTKMLAEKPDLFDLGTSPPGSAGLIVRQVRELGYKGYIVKIGGSGPGQIIQAAGKEAAEGVINYLPADQESPGYKRLAAEFKKMSGNEMNPLLVNWYDGANILMAAIQAAGTTTDTDKVRLAFAKALPHKSVLGGTIRLGGKDLYGIDNAFLTPNYIGVIKNGDVAVMGTAD